MAVYKLSDVYRPVGVPQLTFVKRDYLERSILSWMQNKSKHLLIFGPSKSGKTTLWKQYVPSDKVIKISCNTDTSIESVYSTILVELQTFYTAEKIDGSVNKEGIVAEIGAALGFLSSRVQTASEYESSSSMRMTQIASPGIEANTLVKYLNKSGKIIVLEDFHYAKDNFKEKLSQDLKAFSDDECPWIIVGVQHKTSKLLSYNLDLQQRIAEIPVEGFSRAELSEIIELGERALNISFSTKIKNNILDESYDSASLVQNICNRLCLIKGINETSPDNLYIEDSSLFSKACKEIASEAKKYYGDVVQQISLGGRSDGSTDKYKWFLKMIRDKDIPEHGLRNTEVLAYLRDLGHHDIQQGSVTTGLGYLPKLLSKYNIPSIFDFDGRNFYLLDRYMKFVLKWVPELVDDLFSTESNHSDSTDLKSVNFVNAFSQMVITHEDKTAKRAEIQHAFFGKKIIQEKDPELNDLIEYLNSDDITFSVNDSELLGFKMGDMQFYLGFLYSKDYLSYEDLGNESIRIHLTEKAKRKIDSSKRS